MNTDDLAAINAQGTAANGGMPGTIRVGISSCLLGNEVRFDGGHKRNRFVTDVLSECFEFVPYCPEMAIGMGAPRPPIRLVTKGGDTRVVGVRDAGLDVTQPLREYSERTAGRLDKLHGFILKKDSPSCGMSRVKLYNESGMAERSGVGVFAEAIMSANPLLPVEEEGRLNDAALRDNFITRVYVYARWKQLQDEPLTAARLLDFHTRHKYLLLAHSPVDYRLLGQMLSKLDGIDLEATAERYITRMMQALARPATRKQHSNVLQHLLGYLKGRLDNALRRDLGDAIEGYRRGDYPLVVPVRLLQHQLLACPNAYLGAQVYLDPHPVSLRLRNAV